MTISQSSFVRSPDVSGDYIKTYQDGSFQIQAVVPVDNSGSPIGSSDNPMRVRGLTRSAFSLSVLGSEQQLTAGSNPVTAGSFHASTTHVLWSATEDVRVGFLTPPSENFGHYFRYGHSEIWSVELMNSASFVRATPVDAEIFLTPLTWS